jgi:phosphoribosylpyrophosphate synthetase
VFLGYSLPAADLHAQFIFRCGFHNQLHGRIRDEDSRYNATGAAEVVIVNPDPDAAKRIRAVAGPHIPCSWVEKTIKEWIEDSER